MKRKKNLEEYRDLLAEDKRFIIPIVYPEFSTKRVLAMSYEQGLSIDARETNALEQQEKDHIAAALMDLMYKEIFLWRTVQTDPHFGNYKVRLTTGEQPRLILFDFGAVRKFPKKIYRVLCSTSICIYSI